MAEPVKADNSLGNEHIGDTPSLGSAVKLLSPDGGPLKGLSARQFLHLLVRTWPYLKPQWLHLVLLISMRMAIEVIWFGALLISYDVFNNKVLVGEKLEPAQAALLFVDDSYVLPPEELELKREIPDEEAEEVEAHEFSKLSNDQRKTVRNRWFVVCVFAAIFIFMLAPLVDYYRTWILQRVNQFLRVTMIENAEHLSLRYHNHAKTGDAIYRVYQDSAMITNLLDYLALVPAIALFTSIFSLRSFSVLASR